MIATGNVNAPIQRNISPLRHIGKTLRRDPGEAVNGTESWRSITATCQTMAITIQFCQTTPYRIYLLGTHLRSEASEEGTDVLADPI